MVKVERSYPAPVSLTTEAQKVNGSYAGRDVVERLKKDFHNKCYICELDCLQDPVIEHLLPHMHGKHPERKFNWDNLFWACGHCNIVKNQRKYDMGIIDCCKEDPEKLLSFRAEDSQVRVAAQNEENEKAVLTAQLIMEVFDFRNTGMRVYASEMRLQELNREMNKLYDAIEEMSRNAGNRAVLRKLKALLRRESKFAAFKRNYIRKNLKSYPQLSEYIA